MAFEDLNSKKNTAMQLELKIPPPAVTAAAAAVMWAISWLTPGVDIPMSVRLVVSIALGAAGLVMGAASVLLFLRTRTTVKPERPDRASSLVISGMYRFTRNPMYLGLLFVLTAWAVFLSSAWALLGAAGFVLYMNRFQIAPEERALAKLFGSEYAAYKARVRRWV